jgi:hypothetical protein
MFPDTPDKALGISYPEVVSRRLMCIGPMDSDADSAQIWSMATYYFKYPTLTQAGLCYFLNSGNLLPLHNSLDIS